MERKAVSGKHLAVVDSVGACSNIPHTNVSDVQWSLRDGRSRTASIVFQPLGQLGGGGITLLQLCPSHISPLLKLPPLPSFFAYIHIELSGATWWAVNWPPPISLGAPPKGVHQATTSSHHHHYRTDLTDYKLENIISTILKYCWDHYKSKQTIETIWEIEIMELINGRLKD